MGIRKTRFDASEDFLYELDASLCSRNYLWEPVKPLLLKEKQMSNDPSIHKFSMSIHPDFEWHSGKTGRQNPDFTCCFDDLTLE